MASCHANSRMVLKIKTSRDGILCENYCCSMYGYIVLFRSSVMELIVPYKYWVQHKGNVPAGNGQAGKAPDSRVTNPSSIRNFYLFSRVVQTVAPERNLAPWQNLFGSFAFYFV